MKKNVMMRIASVLMIAVLLTTCVISGTFAKYTSTLTSEGATAVVAKWAFTVGGTPIANNFNFDLFETINDTKAPNGAETNVAAGKIAPGTQGSFAIQLANASEVDAECVISLSKTGSANIPLLFKVDSQDWMSLDELNTYLAGGGKLQLLFQDDGEGEDDRAATVTIFWKWAYEAETPNTNTLDTELGAYGNQSAPAVTFTATITATQID